ncbi:DUF6083 domain-containing protein [Streptomyces syringium]|uniref:DUF6083 domain-containing protein n=1 Tax=Streptomyces syringium TaxID=76729 RepID=UPI0035587F4C
MGGNHTTPDAACPDCGNVQDHRPLRSGGWIRLEPEPQLPTAAVPEQHRWFITADGYESGQRKILVGGRDGPRWADS